MAVPHWQLQTPISAIVFDCDGTLSAIEGIDELAKENGVYEEVAALTEVAMGTTGINPDLYQRRLTLVRPKQAQILALGESYYKHLVPDADQVIHILSRLDKSIYLVSAGLYPAVRFFGEKLKIPQKNIYAVDVKFDSQGEFVDFDRDSPLILNVGKREIIAKIKLEHPAISFIGDGLNDLAAANLVTRFIGYGGMYYRENIAAQCNYYISATSMAALLPLVLTPLEHAKLLPNEQLLYSQGLTAIEHHKVKVENG